MDDELQPWIWLINSRVVARKTAEQVAHEAGISKTYYCQIEQGRRSAYKLATLGRIADALGVSILDLDRSRPPARPGQRHRRNTTDEAVAS